MGPAYDGTIAHGHDDALIFAALCVLSDEQDWRWTGTAEVPARTDPLDEIDQADWQAGPDWYAGRGW